MEGGYRWRDLGVHWYTGDIGDEVPVSLVSATPNGAPAARNELASLSLDGLALDPELDAQTTAYAATAPVHELIGFTLLDVSDQAAVAAAGAAARERSIAPCTASFVTSWNTTGPTGLPSSAPFSSSACYVDAVMKRAGYAYWPEPDCLCRY